MNTLTLKSIAGIVNLFVVLGLALFLPAWSFNFWEAWIFLAVFFVPALLISGYFLRNDPELIERRLKAGPSAEKRGSQKILQALASLFFILIFIVPGFDHRLLWSHVPALLAILADLIVMLGFLIVFLVFKENSYTSAAIEIAPGQIVVSTGPYGVVRHPLYSGALLLVLFTPIALGSWLALPFPLLLSGTIILRLLDEESFLRRSLPGYDEYCQKVRFRLIPAIW